MVPKRRCFLGATAAPPEPLLWKASDGDNSVYLLGSFHLLKPDDYPLSPKAYAALEDAERVLFELSGVPEPLAREALRLASDYACERYAFGVPIGTFQGLSHPLADLVCEVEGGKLLVWKVIHQIAHGEDNAAAHVSLALWWAATTASRACIQATCTVWKGWRFSTAATSLPLLVSWSTCARTDPASV